MTLITIGATTANWSHGGSTVSLRIYADQNFTTSTGTSVIEGDPAKGNIYKTVACTVAGGILTIPAFSIDSTVNSTNQNATYAGWLFDVDSERRGYLFTGWRIPVSFGSNPTFLEISTYNAVTRNRRLINGFPDIEEVIRLINEDDGGITTLADDYDNSLAAAIIAIGATKTTLLIDADTTLSTAETVPATLKLSFSNGAVITKSGSGTLEFEGIGLTDPESQTPIFSGFAAGEITWTGTTPSRLSSSLWDDAVLSARLLKAIAAVEGVTVVAYPGDIAAQVTIKDGIAVHWRKGFYTCSVGVTPFIVHDNMRFYGDGAGQTKIQESPSLPEFIRSSSVKANPFDGLNENIIVEDITFLGNPSTAVNSGQSAILIGNVHNGYIRRCVFDHTHGFAAYVGGFGTAGNTANGCYITDNICIGLQTQNIGTIGGSNIFISKNLFVVEDSSVSLSVIDIEPNNNTYPTENIQITDNIIDARLAQTACNGIAVQQGNGLQARNIRVAGNQIIGADNTVVTFVDSEVNLTTDEITVYDHGMQTGQFIEFATNNAGSGGTLPTGEASPIYRHIISTGLHTFKIATSYANALAGTAVDLTGTGFGSYIIIPFRKMSNGIQVNTVDSCVVENNQITGTSQGGINVVNAYRLIARNNTLTGCGGGGIAAMPLKDSTEGEIYNNVILDAPHPQSQSTTIEETNGTFTVNTTLGSNVITVPGADLPLKWWMRGLTITIDGVDYVISERRGWNQLTLTTNAASTLTEELATLKASSNRYSGNRCGITMAAGTSAILDTATDRLITNVADANATASSVTGIIVYTSLSVGRTVTLPAAATCRGKEIVVKDGAGAAATHNITVDAAGAETIDGAATYVISTNYGRVTVKSDGSNWITL